ncbi:hypothetical protein CDD82_1145 [Ophiocordyceps australis]|uniref:C2H2-type domain-containing protein n=1 Tax=Ophiocordyceps australis TaxID=1399860 RepID=A0A2C5Y031_9HYPO|nr:hypothetical protein CDD82_1145 [Ophiocordyceps australis]
MDLSSYSDDAAFSQLTGLPVSSASSVPMVAFVHGPPSEDPWIPHNCVERSIPSHDAMSSCGQFPPHADGLDYGSFGSESDCATLPGDSGYGGSHETFSMSSATSIYSGDDMSHILSSCALSLHGGRRESRQSNSAADYQCPDCQMVLKSQGELKKHRQRHLKSHVCPYDGCIKGKRGFSTANDLVRHKRSVHGEHTLPGRSFVCLHCNQGSKKPKIWPRADNFRQHLRRTHHIELNASDDHNKYMYQNDLEGVGSAVDPADARYRPQSLAEPSAASSASPATPTPKPYLVDARLPSSNGLWYASASPQVFSAPSHPPTPKSVPPQLSLECHSYSSTPRQHHGQMPIIHNSLHQPLTGYPPISAGYHQGSQLSHMDVAEESRVNWKPSYAGFSEFLQLGLGDQDADMASSQPCRPQPYANGTMSDSETIAYLRKFPRVLLTTALNSPRDDDHDAKSQIACSDPDCGKTFSRRCELKKHQKRHDKPYGCTFKNCHKRFGSKNDWKRHEWSQHSHFERWPCGEPSCGQVYQRREKLEHHLMQHHGIRDSRDIDAKLEAQRQGRHCETSFWCGFCVAKVEIGSPHQEACLWTKRFDHIDNHFFGKDGLVQKSIADWKHPGEPLDHAGHVEAASEAGQGATTTPRERKRRSSLNSFQDGQHDSKHRRAAGLSRNYMWTCCMCTTPMNYQTSLACTECDHQRCLPSCVVEYVASHEEDGGGGLEDLHGREPSNFQSS